LSKNMKTIVESNPRPLCGALFYTLLLCISAFWAMPESARAQIYVSQTGSGANSGTVSEYNATTGAVINANLITGVGQAGAIFLSGNTLYVANASEFGTVGAYNATTGAAINANLITGLDSTAGLLVSGNHLYVASSGPATGNLLSRVGEYDASTGAAINANLIPVPSASSLFGGLALSGNILFVADSTGKVGEYDATTGTVINPSIITVPGAASALLVSGNTLFVGNGSNGGGVGEFNATTGAAINANLTKGQAIGLALSGNNLFVSGQGAVTPGTVSEYNATTGALIAANFVPPLATPIFANGIAVATPQAPIANAGPGQTVQAGTLVTLNGSASSDPSDQLPLTYAWSIVSQPVGGTAALSNPAIVNPTFTANALGNYVIQLVVTDAANLSSAPASVTISTSDAPPVANAGPSQTITATGTLVHLDGTQSYDLAGLAIAYQWSFVSRPAGSNAALTGPKTSKPSFTADVPGDYSVQLVVTDSLGTVSSPSSVLVSFNDVAPIANAGPNQSAVVGGTVTLNGSKSTDTDGKALTYKWSMVSAPTGSKAVILNPTAEGASFVPDLPGTFVVQLIVNDGFLNSLPATAEIVAVSQQPSLVRQIQERQGVIATLPDDGFKFKGARALISLELNDVLLSVEKHDYRAALLFLQVILSQSNGCATIGAPDKNDLITNCPDQSEFYPALLNITAEVRALVPPR
jgi:hypothetical protein